MEYGGVQTKTMYNYKAVKNMRICNIMIVYLLILSIPLYES